jgi:hypothetical protein
MTKTEQEILKALRQRMTPNSDGSTMRAEACFEASSGKGREGGKVSVGWRKLDAANRLVKRGAVRCVKRESTQRAGVSYSFIKIAIEEPS